MQPQDQDQAMQQPQDDLAQLVPRELLETEQEKVRILQQHMQANFEIANKVVRQNRELRRVLHSIEGTTEELTALLPQLEKASKKQLLACILNIKASLGPE